MHLAFVQVQICEVASGVPSARLDVLLIQPTSKRPQVLRALSVDADRCEVFSEARRFWVESEEAPRKNKIFHYHPPE